MKKITELKMRMEAIFTDQEINPEKYNNADTYIKANEEIISLQNQIQSLEWQAIQEQKQEAAVDSIENKNIKSAVKKVTSKIKNYIPCRIEKVDYIDKDTKGIYYSKNKNIQIVSDTMVDTIIHELGHHIHDIINNMYALRVPKTTDYSKTNCMEGFAEAFNCYILNPKQYPKASKRIEKILVDNGFILI